MHHANFFRLTLDLLLSESGFIWPLDQIGLSPILSGECIYELLVQTKEASSH
jgi:hypothetical protein